MATRKRLRPVAAPVDPFVTPANPGPEQSNQTWDGLLQLSNSLFQADAAYREAEERKKREARTQKAEERRERAQAEADAPVGAEVLADLAKKQPGLVARFNKGEATEEDRQTLISAFAEAKISEPNNPALLGEIKKRQVMLLPSNGSYENTMLDPEFLDEVETLPEDEKQAAMQERKAAWIASQNVSESLRPTLLAELRPYDERVNSVLASRRLKQHEAQTNRVLTQAAALATEAIFALDDEKKAAATQQMVSFKNSLSAVNKTKVEKQILGIMSEHLELEITTRELPEADVDEVISTLEDNKLLPAEDIDRLQNKAEAALRARKQRAKDPSSSISVEKEARGKLNHKLFEFVFNNNGRQPTAEQARDIVRGTREELQELFEDSGLPKENADTVILDWLNGVTRERVQRRVDKPEAVKEITEKTASFDPNALTALETYMDNGDLTSSTYRSLFADIQRNNDPEEAETRIARMVSRMALPAGITPAMVTPKLLEVFQRETGMMGERQTAARDAYGAVIKEILGSQSEAERMDVASAWVMDGRASHSGAIRQNIISLTKQYGTELIGEDEATNVISDTLAYIFDSMSDIERNKFRRKTPDQQLQHLTARVQEMVPGTTAGDNYRNHIRETKSNRDLSKTAQKVANITTEQRESAQETDLARVLVEESYREAIAAVTPASWYDSYVYDNTVRSLERFSTVGPGSELSARLPAGVLEYERSRAYQDADKSRRSLRVRNIPQETVMFAALAVAHRVTADGQAISSYKQFADVDSAVKYLRSHYLNYGVPLESLANKEHLGIPLGGKLSWNSSPYFASEQELSQHITKEDGEWKLSEVAEKAFATLNLNTEQETIIRFYDAQRKMLPTSGDHEEVLRSLRTPMFDKKRYPHSMKNNKFIFSYGAVFDMDEFRKKTKMGAK